MTKDAFRNQRVRFRNYSQPYGEKQTFDPTRPSEGTRPRGGVPSRKNGRVVSFWTPGEYDAILLLEATSEIRSYEERPERLVFRNGPERLVYIPSFRVRGRRGTAIVELSADGAPKNAKQAQVANLAREHYASEGIRFVELAHWKVRAKPRRTDAVTIMRYLSVTPKQGEILDAQAVLDGGPVTVADVEARSGVSHGRLLAMVRTGVLRRFGSEPLGLTAKIALNDGGTHP